MYSATIIGCGTSWVPNVLAVPGPAWWLLLQAVLEEVGKWIKSGTSADLDERNDFYAAIYKQVESVSVRLLKPPSVWLLEFVMGFCLH